MSKFFKKNNNLGAQTMSCQELHRFFNGLPEFTMGFDPGQIPENGIYILFEQGETAHGGLRRIVRVGSNTGQGNLRKRLQEHFLVPNKDRSIFRKNIGRALLNKENNPFLAQWEIDLTSRAAREQHANQIDNAKSAKIEEQVSEIIQNKFTFCVFQVDDPTYRLGLEKRLIATVNACCNCRPSDNWFGTNSPKRKIRDSGLWLVQGLNGPTVTDHDLEFIRNTLPNQN